MSQKDAERLRGRLQWFETFAYGRIAHQALRTIKVTISGIASSGREKGNLTTLERQSLTFLRDRVLQAPPTRVLKTSLESWIVFSDGACEGDGQKTGTIGAVLVDPLGRVVRYFSETVPGEWMDAFLEVSAHPSSSWKCFQFCALCLLGNLLSRTVNVCSTLIMKRLVEHW